MPDSEKVSQGGPANFARLFTSYITSNTDHRWIGVMLQTTLSKTCRLYKKYSLPPREYYRLYMPKKSLRNVTQAASLRDDPAKILEEPIARLAKLMEQVKPDVVFLNGFGLLNWMLLKAAERARIPAVIQHAGIWTKELWIHRKMYTTAGRKMMQQMEKDSTHLTTAEIFLNEWSKNYYRQHVAARSDNNTYIVPLPFNFDSFKTLNTDRPAAPLANNSEKFNIGVIARWDEIKNHKMILAAAKIAKRHDLAWQMYAVTSIPETKDGGRQKREYEKYIHVLPSLDREGVFQFCKSVDLLIHPSLLDVSPTVVLEAMSSGTPIAISPTVGYVHDFVTHKADDWVLNTADPSSMVESIAKIEHKTMPQSLHKHLAKIHNQEFVFKSYLDLFERVTRNQS